MYVLKYKDKYCRFHKKGVSIDLVDSPDKASLYYRKSEITKRTDDRRGIYLHNWQKVNPSELTPKEVDFTFVEKEYVR